VARMYVRATFRLCRRCRTYAQHPGPRYRKSKLRSIQWIMSTKDQLLSVALHGTAMRYAAEKRDLAESIAELRKIAGGRDDILAQAAGIGRLNCKTKLTGSVGRSFVIGELAESGRQ
jgi:ribosomal protein L44E